MPNFLPCPFCGNAPILQISKRYPKWAKDTSTPIDGYSVICTTYGCPIYHADNTYFLSAEAAIAKWNNRVRRGL